MVSGQQVMQGAEDQSYLGRLTEGEAKQLVSRNFRLNRLTDMVLHDIANDNRFGYKSIAEVVRHATEMLIDYYQENKMILEKHRGFVSDVLRQTHESRMDADRAAIRAEFTDNIRAHDREMQMARMTGDWQLVGHRLRRYTDMLEGCESEAQRKLLRAIFAESIETRAAVLAFSRWLDDPSRPPNEAVEGWDDSWPLLVEQWQTWYSDWENV